LIAAGLKSVPDVVGSVAEWSIAPVLKTGNGQPFVSSNLTASATNGLTMRLYAWFASPPTDLPPQRRWHGTSSRPSATGHWPFRASSRLCTNIRRSFQRRTASFLSSATGPMPPHRLQTTAQASASSSSMPASGDAQNGHAEIRWVLMNGSQGERHSMMPRLRAIRKSSKSIRTYAPDSRRRSDASD
jgi:hypothetical protein